MGGQKRSACIVGKVNSDDFSIGARQGCQVVPSTAAGNEDPSGRNASAVE
jgi:hypothetical protein